MKDKPDKKIFGGLVPWKPMLPQSTTPKEPAPAPGDYRREVFEPIFSRTIEMDKFAAEVVLRYRDLDGEHEIRTCPGDIYKIVNVFMDYARLLEVINDEWNLDAYRRAVNEVTADKLRAIARKYQTAIGYDYDAAVARCEAKKKKKPKDDDIGGDALDLAYNKSQREAMKKAADKKKKG